MNKISIRFYNDREVRAIWDEEKGQWYFSVLDVIGAINEQDDYTKTRNYWKYLKTKLKKDGNELVSVTHQLKLLAPDDKLRLTDRLMHRECPVWQSLCPTRRQQHFLIGLHIATTPSTDRAGRRLTPCLRAN